jgi:hypothetical protein
MTHVGWLDDGNGPIFKVHEYHHNPEKQWTYSTFSGGGGGGGSDIVVRFPYITHWKLDGSLIRVRKVLNALNENKVRRYYNPDPSGVWYVEKDEDATGSPEDDVVLPVQPGSPANYGWSGHEYHVYSDGTREKVWSWAGYPPPGGYAQFAVGASTVNCRIGSGAVGYGGPFSFQGNATRNFALDAGFQPTDIIHNISFTPDGKKILFTYKPSGGINDRPTLWAWVENGVITETGGIYAGMNFLAGKRHSLSYFSSVAGQCSFEIGTIEQNGRYWWNCTMNNSTQPTIFGPLSGVHVGVVEIFWIDDTGTLGWLSSAKFGYMTQGGFPSTEGIAYGACCVPEDGFFGVHSGRNMALFARRPIPSDEPRIFVATP